jgi:hypothetical protein
MNYFPRVSRWLLPVSVLEQSVAEMSIDGRDGNEGTCFWLGRRIDGDADVSHAVFLRGRGVRKSPLKVWVSPELMREVHEQADSLGLILVGQIHSHSSQCGVDMSASDHAYGVSVPFFLNVICPHYGQDPLTTIFDCGVHICRPRRRYVRLSRREVQRKIIMVPGGAAGTSVVGEDL